jgi:hypothetical protein
MPYTPRTITILRIEFRAHLLWKVDPENVKTFVEKYGETGGNPEKMAYDNFIKEPFRTYTRDQVQKYDGLDIKANMDAIGSAVQARIFEAYAWHPLHSHQRRRQQYFSIRKPSQIRSPTSLLPRKFSNRRPSK